MADADPTNPPDPADDPGPALLVCAATLPELATFWRDGEASDLSGCRVVERRGDVAFVLTGVGVPCALGRLLPLLGRLRPRRILNLGIAGAYRGSGLAVGDVVMGVSEVYGDVGFELPEEPGFQSIREAPFGGDYERPFPLAVDPAFQRAPGQGEVALAGGCTVSTCTGTERTGEVRRRLFGVGFETMEGAAVAQAGQAAGIPVCEVRAISNLAARRDVTPENIRLALARLREHLAACRGRGDDR